MNILVTIWGIFGIFNILFSFLVLQDTVPELIKTHGKVTIHITVLVVWVLLFIMGPFLLVYTLTKKGP